jgi:hypothetical protein
MTASSTQRTLAELQTLYTLHPQIKDVIVEGRNDARFYNWYLTSKGITAPRMYAVDDRIEVPSSEVLALGQDVNARGRILAIAASSESWTLEDGQLTCIIDADFDCLETSPLSYSNLFRTDFPALEVYGILEGPLSKFLSLHTTGSATPSQVIGALREAWATIFAVRFELKRIDVALSTNFIRCCAVVNNKLEVRALDLVQRSCKLGRFEQERIARLAEETASGLLRGDYIAVRGHDVAPIFKFFLSLKRPNISAEVLEDILLSCIQPEHLDPQALFVSLKARLT